MNIFEFHLLAIQSNLILHKGFIYLPLKIKYILFSLKVLYHKQIFHHLFQIFIMYLPNQRKPNIWYYQLNLNFLLQFLFKKNQLFIQYKIPINLSFIKYYFFLS